jgi:hypothetical protein
MRPTHDWDRARARVSYRLVPIPFLTAVAIALSACADSSTAPKATNQAPEAREARAFTEDGVTYPTVSIEGASATLAVGGQETLQAKLATPTATWVGAYITWTSSNTKVVSVSTSDWGSTSGDQATVTGLAQGTATIAATTKSGTSQQFTITVGSGVAAPSGPYHEPAGMVAQINTGPMTILPATSYPANKWTQGTTTFSNFSPTTMSSTGEWSQNLSHVPDGSGVRVTYGPSLVGGNSPVRFGASIPNHGTGHLYIRWRFRLSPNWTLSRASGLKVMEPRTVNSTENHVLGAGADGQATDGSNMWFGALLQFSTGSGTQGINVPGNSEGQSPVPSQVFSGNTANVGGGARGQWHLMEAYYQPESPAGAPNGQLTLWVDGAQVFQTGSGAGSPPGGTHFFLSGESMGWNYIMFDPTYGGDASSDHPPTSIYWDIDQLYVSTK